MKTLKEIVLESIISEDAIEFVNALKKNDAASALKLMQGLNPQDMNLLGVGDKQLKQLANDLRFASMPNSKGDIYMKNARKLLGLEK
jgi:hypothetical protein